MSAHTREIAALDTIARLGHLSIFHHPTLGGICGSTTTTCAALRRLAHKGKLDAESFLDNNGDEWTIFAAPRTLRLPLWAKTRLERALL